jgi:LAGLIDADG endonuclease
VRSDAGPWFSREFLSAYISGYADGEGCFTVSISPRASLRVGWEVRPGFSVSQNGDRAEVLHALQAYFGCGSIRPDRSDRTLKWETRRLGDLLERVIPTSNGSRFCQASESISNGSRASAASWR